MPAVESRVGQIGEGGMSKYELKFPDWYDDLAWEHESKGWLEDVVVTCNGVSYRLAFYSPTRLRQDIECELHDSIVFFEPNLVVVPDVNRQCIEAAIDLLVRTGEIGAKMCPMI